MSKNKEETIYGKAIKLESVKVHDAINLKGKVSSYWSAKESNVDGGLTITYYPELSGVMIDSCIPKTIKPILIPISNIPFMTPWVDA